MTDGHAVIPNEQIERSIQFIRDHPVMLDRDLPDDFMFQLTKEEFDSLKSQSVISSSGWGGRRYPPYAFTEQGAAMLSSVLRSKRAVEVNIEIMRAFVRLRQMPASNEELSRRLNELEDRHDEQFQVVFEAIRQLMTPPAPARRRLGFPTDGERR